MDDQSCHPGMSIYSITPPDSEVALCAGVPDNLNATWENWTFPSSSPPAILYRNNLGSGHMTADSSDLFADVNEYSFEPDLNLPRAQCQSPWPIEFQQENWESLQETTATWNTTSEDISWRECEPRVVQTDPYHGLPEQVALLELRMTQEEYWTDQLQLCSTRLDARAFDLEKKSGSYQGRIDCLEEKVIALEGSRELLQQSNSQLEKQMDSASKQIDRLTEQNTALRW
ncbi:hypothetical protein EJ05DRAFT_384080 [Pseudovirgaria hyperparasitica]|uniref:Uncharacterized protein n=1 Tax=Pseudovirgaria hyperparasitica TaxID=470096 RepID=A0A6A6VT27_9PEZI|nr:uncharacterized protein EJ05DRAFT_384080 [Pseudovirgaria hyperparasitica]KAF2752397.1 hypothetical protein EJ05DRAFT_384080 [Pseudovirgaria hyperparasitica]